MFLLLTFINTCAIIRLEFAPSCQGRFVQAVLSHYLNEGGDNYEEEDYRYSANHVLRRGGKRNNC